MQVNVDVYTTDVDAGMAAFKKALDAGAVDVQLRSYEDYESKKFECLNLMFEADHMSEALTQLDSGPFKRERP